MAAGMRLESTGRAQRIGRRISLPGCIADSGKILTKGFGRLDTLATGFVDGRFRDFDVDDSGFDELAPCKCVHELNP